MIEEFSFGDVTSGMSAGPSSDGVPLRVKGDWSIIGIHGGGERRWEKTHPVFHLGALLGFSNFYTVTLPLHGGRSSAITWDSPENDYAPPPTKAQFLDAVFDALLPLIKNKKVLFACHSGGGMTMNNLWERVRAVSDPETMLITIGSGVYEPEHSQVIGKYWSKASYERLGSFPILERIHGKGRAERMIKFWAEAAGDKGWVFLKAPQVERLYAPGTRAFSLLGNKDQPFPPASFLKPLTHTQAMERVVLVESDHYRYFSDFWSATRKGMLSLIVRYIPLERGPDEDVAAEVAAQKKIKKDDRLKAWKAQKEKEEAAARAAVEAVKAAHPKL